MPNLAAPGLLLPLALGALCSVAPAQSADEVLRIYSPNGNRDVRFIDSSGGIVHRVRTQFVPAGVDVDSSGAVIRGIKDTRGGPMAEIGGAGGGIQRMAYDGTILWDWRYNTPPVLSHHDIEPLPNGNVLMIAWDVKPAAEAVAAGRDPALLSTTYFVPDHIIEVQPTGPTSGTVVWQWHVWDHLVQDRDPTKANFGVVADHPELVDINYPPWQQSTGQFSHVNAVDYDPIHDWILLSSPKQNEIWIIDHGTTTAEAAGHTGGRWGKGGDLLYRWGNPAAYRAGPGSAQMLSGQHASEFIPPGYPGAGNVTVFNNHATAGGSSVVEIVLPLDPQGNFILDPSGRYGPSAPTWSYSAPGFFSAIMSSAQRLPNGNTLICSATQGWIFEVTPAGQIVSQHFGQAGNIFHARHTRRTLWSNDTTVAAATGGRVDFDLLTGAHAANHLYLVLCSASGTTPGTPIAGVTLPLNPDPFLIASLSYPNAAPVFIQTLGTLGPVGQASAAFTLPAGLVPSGFRLDFAFARFAPSPLTLEAASNTVPLVTF